MRAEVSRLEGDGEAEARLAQQRRAVRLNSWIDRGSGMGRWSASWDPEAMVRLENRLDAQVEALFHDTQPPGLPVELPRRVLDDLAKTARIHTVVVRNGTIIHAPGELNLGRTTRIANRAQRRALGAVYATCAIPGCCVRYSRTKLHHLIWWRHDGLTDLDNLLPLCVQHHHNIHHDGWQLTLTPDRTLTIQLPDGTIMTTGPPTRGAA